jgi:hypothetical protein
MLSAAPPALPPAVVQQEAPALTQSRSDEDYSYLADPAGRNGDWWERLAYVPLAADGSTYLSTGLELRLHYEGYRNDAWSTAEDADHDYLWSRALPYVSLNHGGFRLFTQLIAAAESGDEAATTPIDEDRADFLQAFAEVQTHATADAEIGLRAGRQVLSYGSERLIGPRYGPNVLRSFDVARLSATQGRWRFDGLYGRPVDARTGSFDDRSDDSQSLWMLYATHAPAAGDPLGLDLYSIGLHADDAAFEAGTGEERRTTFGSRIFGEDSGWDWNFELFAQLGSFAGDDIRAWSVASDTGRALTVLGRPARAGLKADIISGDHDAADDRLETFNPLFPKGKYFGESSLIGPSNLIDLHPTLGLELDEAWSLKLGGVLYWRESTGDGIYDNGGNLVRASGGSEESFIGTQLDASIGWQIDRNLDIALDSSYFFAGSFLADTGDSEDVAFLSLELRFRY